MIGASPHVVVTGLVGAGKSSLATPVAERLGRRHLDSDGQIETLFGCTGAEIAEADGVDALHDLEEAVLLGALSFPDPLVVSAAAWVVECEPCRRALARRSTVVWLDVPVELALRRAATGTHRRTIDPEALTALHQRRRPLFEAVADLRLDATRSVDDLVDELVGFVTR
ncbi:MAG: shikimate kinase [Actinomycetota bacterium]